MPPFAALAAVVALFCAVTQPQCSLQRPRLAMLTLRSNMAVSRQIQGVAKVMVEDCAEPVPFLSTSLQGEVDADLLGPR